MYKKLDSIRKEEIASLKQIIDNREYYKENSEEGLSILINGSWGSGKSTFINSFKESIDSKKYEILDVYNSFEYDFYENPFIPFFSFLHDELMNEIDVDKIVNITSNHVNKKIIDVVCKIGKDIIKNKTGVDISNISQILDQCINEYTEKSSVYNDFEELNKIKKDIKQKIEKKKKTIILLIDELDRCNPKFAIGTLEIIKYFFDIKNFIVIISLDKKQLQESVKTIYGQNMDSDIYFSKFFDYQFNLTKLEFKDIVDYSGDNTILELLPNIDYIFNKLSISIRDSKKIFNEFSKKYKLYSSENKKWTNMQCIFIIFMITLKNTDLVFYNNIINKRYMIYKRVIENDNDIDNKKYINLLTKKWFEEISFDDCITRYMRNYNKPYPSLNYYGMSSLFYDKKKETETINAMFPFIPQLEEKKTYEYNLLKILEN